MSAPWIRGISAAVFAVASVICVTVVQDLGLVAAGVVAIVVAALMTAAGVLGVAAIVTRRRPSIATALTVTSVVLALWAPLPARWHHPCSQWGVAALWAAPIAVPVYRATGIPGVVADSRLSFCFP